MACLCSAAAVDFAVSRSPPGAEAVPGFVTADFILSCSPSRVKLKKAIAEKNANSI